MADKIPASALRFEDELVGAHHGQLDMVCRAFWTGDDGQEVQAGFAEYVLWEGELLVSMVESEPRRRGIATAMYEHILALNPEHVLITRSLTTDGALFRAEFDKTHADRLPPAPGEVPSPFTEDEWKQAMNVFMQAKRRYGPGSDEVRRVQDILDEMNDFDSEVYYLGANGGRARTADPIAKPALPALGAGARVSSLVAYHGTRSPVDFAEFSMDGPPVEALDDHGHTDSGSGADPSAYLGAHFALEPAVASKFATGQGAAWMRARYVTEGEAGPRILPVVITGRFCYFESEEEAQSFIFRQNLNSADVEETIQSGAGWNDDAAEDLFARYDEAESYREGINRETLSRLQHEEEAEAAIDFARELAQAARAALEAEGYDGYIYPNSVEGGTSVAVWNASAIEPLYAPSSMNAQIPQARTGQRSGR